MNKPVKPSDNPFRSSCVDALGYVSPTGETWAELVSRIRAACFRGALVGPHGHGKSTLMHQLAALDPPPGRARHDVIQVMLDGSNRGEVKDAIAATTGRLFIDGIDLLPWRMRSAIGKREQVIVTSHRPTKLPTLMRCETTPVLLGELIGQLSPPVYEALGEDAIVTLHAKHHGNIRDALRELYDRVASGQLII
ncbi:MAG: hypothetical protein AAF593_11910 [Planctomycetota bacterium]